MPNRPPLKSAQNKPRILGASGFTQKYSSMIPKTEIDSPRYDNLVKSAVKMKQLKNFDYKVDNAGRQKRSSVEAMTKIINK